MPRSNRPVTKDMYWFAHGGPENTPPPKGPEEEEPPCETSSPSYRLATDKKSFPDEQRAPSNTDGSQSSGPSSLTVEQTSDRLHSGDRQAAVEERRKQLWDAEQERNEAVLRKHMEREAALEARRNAQRGTGSFAFGSSVPRGVDALSGNESANASAGTFPAGGGSSPREENQVTNQTFQCFVSPLNSHDPNTIVDGLGNQLNTALSNSSYSEQRVISPPSWLVGSGAMIGEDLMTKSMTGSFCAPRGRRKNDLMPTVPYDRLAAPKFISPLTSARKRSVSMTRLDQLALPRRHYAEAVKAGSSSAHGQKENSKSPTRPLSSASDKSGASHKMSSSVTRRVRSSPRKPRPVSVAGSLPDKKQNKESPIKQSYASSKRTAEASGDIKKTPVSAARNQTPKSPDKTKQFLRSAPAKSSSSKPATPKTPKTDNKTSVPKPDSKSTPPKSKRPSPPRTSTPKTSLSNKSVAIKAKSEALATAAIVEAKENIDNASLLDLHESVILDPDVLLENEKNNAKRFISEEEAKTALAEKRRIAREQAEREAEVERQKQEELRAAKEERARREEEEQRRAEEEQLRLMEEHRREEEEKLRKAIHEQEQREEEERLRREEDSRARAEQEKKAKEEAEKQRFELEEKLRKEDEERAERKKRLEKIMSRTRGKSNGTSPSGSISGSEHFDSGENSLDSNEEQKSEPVSGDEKADADDITEVASYNAAVSEGESSLNSNDLMMPVSEEIALLPADDEKDIAHQGGDVVKESEVSNNDGSVPQESLTKLQTSLNVNAPEFTPTGFGSVHAFGFEQSESPVQKDSIETDAVHEALVPQPAEFLQPDALEPNSFAKTEDVYLQFGKSDKHRALSQEFEAQDIVDSTKFKEDITSYHAPGFQLPDPELEISESNQRSSVSSDMKLPDPIYETSEDGSVLSDKLHQDFKGYGNDEMNFGKGSGNVSGFDEVFSEQGQLETKVLPSSVLESTAVTQLQPTDFALQESSVDDDEDQFRMSFPAGGTFDMSAGIYDMQTSSLSQDRLEGYQEEKRIIQSATNETEKLALVSEANENCIEPPLEANLEVNESSIYPFPAESKSNDSVLEFKNPFENSKYQSHEDQNSSLMGDNPFYSSNMQDLSNVRGQGDYFYQHSLNLAEQPLASTDKESDFSDITVIKSDNNQDFIGIVSSVEHDQALNDLPRADFNTNQLGSNFEYSSVTDSEDSSLDSNLSQVVSADGSKEGTNGGLNHVENSVPEPNSLIFINGDHSDNPFGNYQSSLLQTNGKSFGASELITNGHSNDPSNQVDKLSDLHAYDKGILSVDPSQNSIFESADVTDFSKSSPDPFLAKGGSKQISGNPFAAQDDQKQVLMTTDFLN